MVGGRSGSRQLLCALAILAALTGTLIFTDGAPESSPGRGATTADLDPEEVARISVAVTPEVARRVERIRGLDFDRLPEPEVVSSEYLNRLGARVARRADGDSDLGADEAVLRMLGLLGPEEQLEPALSSSGDLAAAAYDTRSGRLYVVEDAVVANRALIEFFLAHELNHALEDQRFGLDEGGPGDDDRALAGLALIEGTATAQMIEYGGRHLDSLELLAASAGLSTDTGEVPRTVIDQLTWAYLGGNEFVAELRRLGGGWTLVDYALEARPPASTEQVLHPKKFIRDERPEQVRVASGPLPEGGWQPTDDGVVGELATSQLLRLGGDEAAARRGAAGWDGDRYELWRRGASPQDCAHPCREKLVLALVWRWDAPRDVGQFVTAVEAYLRALDADRLEGNAWEADGGAVAFRAGPAATTLVFAPDAELATQVATAQPLTD